MKTVFVGLSGGVDSGVSAALLKERGFNVVGAFIKIWQPEFTECTWKEDRLDAMRVCAALGIPFKEIDLSDEYQKEVVKTMIADYASGITPNPDVLCNRSIKFGHFKKWALENGADMIATGHYARVREHNGVFELLRGNDTNKDQSYFLYRLNQDDLSRTLFPVGEYTKPEVRELAKRFDLPVAHKHDSQGLCFVGDVSMKDFLGRFITLKKGDVLDEHNEVVGTHEGAVLYTIGERHGFSVAGEIPRYVVGIDVTQNIIHVSTRREDAAKKSIGLSDLHWIGKNHSYPLQTQAQARYREKAFAVNIVSENKIEFEESRIAAPGQSLVLYDNDVCLGGGIVTE